MPWINQNICDSCGLCMGICPVQAIRLNETGKPQIHDDTCIRCGKCHDICPVDAVRHDSEKIPVLVEQNMAKTSVLLKNYDKLDEQHSFIDRMVRHYAMQRKVADITIEQLKVLKTNLHSSGNATNEDTLYSQT